MKIRYILLSVISVALYIVAGACVPYVNNPNINDEDKTDFSIKDFYSDKSGPDRAKIITDNEEALRERIRMISQAGERIILSTFAFESDTSGKQMIAALEAAADRGVSVRLLVDGFNSWFSMEGNPYFIHLANHENVQIKLYNKVNLFTPWKAMSRMHDKYIVADEKVYIAGGRNTFDYFLGNAEGYKNYDMDVMVYNIGKEESSIYELVGYFEEFWAMDCCKLWRDRNILNRIQPSVDIADKELEQLYLSMQEEHPDWFEEIDYLRITVPTDKVTLLAGSKQLYAKSPKVFYGLYRLMMDAKENVTIHTPYIICDDYMYQALGEISHKNTDVILMTNSVENNGNPFGAVDYYLHRDEILNTGFQVLEYDGERSYHSKCIAIDNNISVVGSFNMDMRSTYQNTEIMLVVDSRALNEQLRDSMSYYEQSAKPANYESGKNELFADGVPASKKVQRWIIKLLDPYIRFLL